MIIKRNRANKKIVITDMPSGKSKTISLKTDETIEKLKERIEEILE